MTNETDYYNYTSPMAPSIQNYKQPLSLANLDEPLLIIPNSAALLSPNISQTGPQGLCLNFFYNMDGLSAEKLRVLVKDIETNQNQTLWESASETEGRWVRAAVAYAYETTHQVSTELGIHRRSSASEPMCTQIRFVHLTELNYKV